jgi:hypothetical protein
MYNAYKIHTNKSLIFACKVKKRFLNYATMSLRIFLPVCSNPLKFFKPQYFLTIFVQLINPTYHC